MGFFQRLLSIFPRTRKQKGPGLPSVERGWTDSAIEKFADDRFDFRDYAEVLARRARNADTPLTIGIYGSWGSGKTSLMHLLDKDPSMVGIRKIWVNVWQLSNQEEVWQAFLQALFNEVNRKLSLWRRIDKRKLIRSLVSNSYRIVVVATPLILGALINNPDASWEDVIALLTFRFANATNPTVVAFGSFATYGLALWVLLKPAIEASREVVNIDLKSILKHASYEEQITELVKLQKRFTRMVEDLIRGQGDRLLVFIDDLDRCAPDKIPDLLEAIKLFTTTPRCVYILGMDHDIVRKGIQKKYTFDQHDAEDYLEKIVQVPFHMPPLDESKILEFIDSSYDLRCPTAAEVFSKGLEPNPRTVKRALNIYRTVLELADKRVSAWGMDDVEDELVAKMIIIQSRFRILYERLIRQPELLLMIEEKFLSAKDNSQAKRFLRGIDTDLFGTYQLEPERIQEPGLINESELEALIKLLKSGDHKFSEESHREQIRSYIYLIATTEGTAAGIRPSRKERDALLGGIEGDIKAQVEEVVENGRRDIIINRLMGVLKDIGRYTPNEIDSANLALDYLEGLQRQEFEPQLVRVPAGEFLMGSGDNDKDADENEKPQLTVLLPDYYIGKYPVTNLEYQAFVKAKGYRSPTSWDADNYPEGKGDHPVVYVSWEDAQAYCQWLAETTGKAYRLPTEAEWEKAARGTDGRNYPWGNEWNPERCNTEESKIDATTPVGQYSPEGDSPFGTADMAGNVWEWCADWWDETAYKNRSGKKVENPTGPESGALRVLRGGSFSSNRSVARCAVRRFPVFRLDYFGFRVVVSPFDAGEENII